MTVSQIIVLTLIMTVLPLGMGLVFTGTGIKAGLAWVCGIMLMWAVTFAFAVPLIVLQKPLSLLIKAVGAGCLIIFVAGLAAYLLCRKKASTNASGALSKAEIVYLGVFLGLMVFQLYKAVAFSYSDGDDAFYVATAQVSDSTDSMYRFNPYTGRGIGLESMRYRLAPFPMWIAMLARVSGINAATVSHVFMPLFLIPVTYIIYNEIGNELFSGSREKKYMFLILIAVIALFSGFTLSTAERFMLTRTRQGKEALANIVLPFVFLLMIKISGKDSQESKVPAGYLILLTLAGVAGALTSVFSNILIPTMVAFLAAYLMFVKKRFKAGFLTALTVIPEGLVLLYYVLGR